MARRQRIEIEGGLYHLVARGNDRRDIFHSREDHLKFLALLAKQKERSPYYLYAYCLMTNHFHLLVERQTETVGNLMQRVLTGYSQYYNRRYGHVGHVFQGRHKAILCQSHQYLAKLVRYIHLNPLRARMVTVAEDYPYSSQKAYLGIEPTGIIDVDPVLRLFGSRKEIARRNFADYVCTASGEDESEYSSAAGDVLGNDEFVDENIHRLGDVLRKPRQPSSQEKTIFDIEKLLAAIETVFGISRDNFCGPSKNIRAIMAKEVFILTGKEAGISVAQLSDILSMDNSNVSRRYDAAKQNVETDTKLAYAKAMVKQKYHENIAESHA